MAEDPSAYPSVSAFVAEAIADRLTHAEAHQMLVAVLRDLGGDRPTMTGPGPSRRYMQQSTRPGTTPPRPSPRAWREPGLRTRHRRPDRIGAPRQTTTAGKPLRSSRRGRADHHLRWLCRSGLARQSSSGPAGHAAAPQEHLEEITTAVAKAIGVFLGRHPESDDIVDAHLAMLAAHHRVAVITSAPRDLATLDPKLRIIAI